jgi:hypothetical protein
MKMPGFNAANALYQSDISYRMVGQPMGMRGRQVVIPQQRGEAEAGGLGCAFACTCCALLRDVDCCQYCIDNCFTGPHVRNGSLVILKR